MYELKYCFVVFDGISSFFFFFLLRSEPSSHTSYLCPSGSCDTRSLRRHDAGRRGAASDEFWSGVTPATVWTQHQLRNWFQLRSVASFFCVHGNNVFILSRFLPQEEKLFSWSVWKFHPVSTLTSCLQWCPFTGLLLQQASGPINTQTRSLFYHFSRVN